MTGLSNTVVYDKPWAPKLTLTVGNGFYTAVVGLSGLSPQRDLTAEEKRAGITSLNPPTVKMRARLKRADTHRALIDICCRAVGVAAWASTGETGGPAGVLMTYLRTSLAVRGALRLLAVQLGEDMWDSTKGWP